MPCFAALILCVRRFSPVRLLAGLLLLAAAVQAAAPGYAPLEPTRGSAFSAGTADVALAPTRQGDAIHTAPLPPLTATVPEVPAPLSGAARPSLALRPDSTGPPAAWPRLLLPEPRAPPFA